MLETYIQTTYFERIIRRANLRFMIMSGGQYEFKRTADAGNLKSQSGLELSVIDHYNGTVRSVKTLSGGELNILRWRSHPISWDRVMESVIESHSSDGGSHDPCRGSQ